MRKGLQNLIHLWQLCLESLQLLFCPCYSCKPLSYTFAYNDQAVTLYEILYQTRWSSVVSNPLDFVQANTMLGTS